jgi:hypothetical protein
MIAGLQTGADRLTDQVKRLSRVAVIVVAVTACVGLPVPNRGHAAPPSCAPFNDPGCLFGENFESGTTSGWAANDPSNFSNVTGGLAGTSRTAQLHYSGSDRGIWADTAAGGTLAVGQVVWFEFRVKWSPGWRWGASLTAPSATYKTFEFDTVPCLDKASGVSTGYGRLLLGVETNYISSKEGEPSWHVYPNTTCAGGTGQETFDTSSTGSSFRFAAGTEYHVITELKFATNNTGYLKTWVNGTLVINAPNIRTVGGTSLSVVRIGGQFGNVIGSGENNAWYDQVRITTTNLAPGANSSTSTGVGVVPSNPSGVRFQ